MTRIIESLSTDPGILLGAVLGSLAILAFTTILITAMGTLAWRKVRQTECNNALKHALLEQGLSAGEIVTVIEAWPNRRHRGNSYARFSRKHDSAAVV